MRKFAITLAAAAAAAGLAAPASATWYPQPAYGYGYGQGYGYNHYNGYAQARGLQHRVNYLQREIARLARYRMISRAEYYDLRRDSRGIEQRLYHSTRFGLHPSEAYVLQRQIARLEYKIRRDVRDGRRWAYRW